ncbi:MAG TPA: MobA/MobL family protein [Candidatus Sulfotelmatobacter sp.]|jgi:hypothetical protein|nr:MobA/MobL family protein [Candidatus Sulfotelmatobacter sp.]
MVFLVDDDLKAGQGRYREAQKVSRRVGPGGRTFHIEVKTITKRKVGKKQGGAAQAIAGLDYDARHGKHSRRRDELELEGGRDRREMAEILQAAEAANTRSNGKVALDLEVELPLEATPDQRRQIVERVAAWFENKGCPTHWAIHSRNSTKELQPHFHMTVTARPVHQVDGGWVGTAPGRRGDPGPPAVINGGAEMENFRRQVVAAAVNDVTGLNWHGGRLEETGIDRPAKRRLPMAAYKGTLAAREDGPASTNTLIDQGAYELVRRRRADWVSGKQKQRQAKKAAGEAQKAEQLARLGGVPRAEAEAVCRAANRRLQEVEIAAGERERELRAATARQAAMIIGMAKEAGVSVTQDQLERLDGGDLVAAVRKAKSGDRAAFEQRISEAETRALHSAVRTICKAAGIGPRAVAERYGEDWAARPEVAQKILADAATQLAARPPAEKIEKRVNELARTGRELRPGHQLDSSGIDTALAELGRVASRVITQKKHSQRERSDGR